MLHGSQPAIMWILQIYRVERSIHNAIDGVRTFMDLQAKCKNTQNARDVLRIAHKICKNMQSLAAIKVFNK